MTYVDFIYILLTLLASALFSGSEIAYLSSDKMRLEIDRSRGGVISRILNLFYRYPDKFITTMLLGNNVALVIYGILMAKVLEPLLGGWLQNDTLMLLAQSIIGTIIILFLGEFLPKVTFRSNANELQNFFAPILWLIYVLLYPFVYLISLLTKAILWIAGQKTTTVAIRPSLSMLDLEHYLTNNRSAGEEEGDMDTEVKIIQNVISFPSLQVRDCMIPRNEMIAVELHTERQELEEKFMRSGLSKVIVYQKNIDEVVGYIHSIEMFREGNWQDRITQAVFVPESMLASTLMTQLMQRKKSIAIVIDELGGTAGMVTLEDIVEEIFGDIEDEHDRNKLVAKRVDDKEYLLSGRMEIDDVNEQFDLNLPESEEYMTIAGFILHHHQNIPLQGEEIEVEGFRFEILRSTSTKIVLVRMHLS